jgi:hypothetical protein
MKKLLGAALFAAIALRAAQAAPVTACFVEIKSCPNRTDYANQAVNDPYEGSGTSPSVCARRAADYYNWCGTSEPVISYYMNMQVQQTTTYPASAPPPSPPLPPPPPPPPDTAGLLHVQQWGKAIVNVLDDAGTVLTTMYFPEYIKADGFGDEVVPQSARPVNTTSFYYIQPSTWEDLGNGAWKMTQDYPGYIKFEVVITPGNGALYYAMRIFNYRNQPLVNLTSDFDASCKQLLESGGQTLDQLPAWFTTLVYQQASSWSPSAGWQLYPQGGPKNINLLACQSMDRSRVVALAMEQIGEGTHANSNTCIHTIGLISASLAPNAWSAWQHRAVYVLTGDLNAVSSRFQQDFVQGGASNKWP